MEIDNELILKYQRCETTPAEEDILLDYLDESEEHRKRLDEANFLYCAGVLHGGGGRKHRNLVRLLSGIAALLLVGFAVWALWPKSPDRSSEDAAAQVVVEAPEGSRSRVSLPDGSVVWLNSGSRLTYPETFDRKVTLEGEGYFDVVYHPDMPFSVSALGLCVKVLGTVFNLRAYSREDRLETTLATGSVSLQDAAGKRLFLLHPGEQVSCCPDGSDLDVRAADAWTLLLDTYGVVTVPDASLTELCSILNHAYGVTVKSRSDDGTPVTFSFSKDSPVEEVVSRLSTLTGKQFDIRKEGNL